MTATKPAKQAKRAPAAERVPPAAAAALRYLHRVPAAARNLWIGGVLLAICVIFAVSSPYFLTRANWLNTSSTATEVLLLAVGETFVICSGGIDLSVGAVLGCPAHRIIGALDLQHRRPAGLELQPARQVGCQG